MDGARIDGEAEPLSGSFSEKALFFTQMYPSRAVGGDDHPPESKLRPTPIDIDHWSPSGWPSPTC